MALVQRRGVVSFLRVHDVGSGFGPPDDSIDVEVVVQLVNEQGSFGFQLRNDQHRHAHNAMFELLLDAFGRQAEAVLDVDVPNGKRNGVILRVAVST